MSHEHRPAKTHTEGFVGEVTADLTGYYKQNRLAHGGTTVVDTCACGATRRTNRNLGHVERGRWTVPSLDRAAQADAKAQADAERKRDELRVATLEAIGRGMTESEAARRAGVTRMTIRAWLGK